MAAALFACSAAQAKQSDKNQPINLEAGHATASQQSGRIILSGGVKMDQGSFHADGVQASGYTDPGDTSQWQRVVLTGAPAHFRQTQDNGTMVHGQAANIDYRVSENTVVLTGNATVVQQGRGTFHGEKLVYDTDSGQIEGSAAPGGRVHITLQPRSKPAPASTRSAPAPAGSAPAPAGSVPAPAASPPAPAASAPAVSPSSAAPASASTTGMH